MGSVKLRVNGRTSAIIAISLGVIDSPWISGSLLRVGIPVSLRRRRARRSTEYTWSVCYNLRTKALNWRMCRMRVTYTIYSRMKSPGGKRLK